MILRCYSNINDKICLEFYPCKNLGEDISWEEWHRKKPLTIFSEDYQKLLIDFLKELYPTKDPTNNEVVESFDVCFDNWIGKSDWLKIIKNITQRINKNNNRPTKLEKEFYENFIEWVEKELEWADIIVVEGNL